MAKLLNILEYKSKHLVMKNSMKFAARILMLCFTLSMTGNLYAQPSHPPKKHKHRYYYYPKQNVYYDPAASVYFVWESNHWKPIPHYWSTSYFVYSDSPRMELWIASEHPYYYNAAHRRTYYAYRVPTPPPAPRPAPAQARVRVDSRPKPNVSFHLEINSRPEPQPVYVEERVIVVKERGRGHHHHGHGHGHHPGHGRGRGHH